MNGSRKDVSVAPFGLETKPAKQLRSYAGSNRCVLGRYHSVEGDGVRIMQKCQCESRDHQPESPETGVRHRWGAPDAVELVRTEYGIFAVCPECLRANHMLVRNPSAVWRG